MGGRRRSGCGGCRFCASWSGNWCRLAGEWFVLEGLGARESGGRSLRLSVSAPASRDPFFSAFFEDFGILVSFSYGAILLGRTTGIFRNARG